MRQKLASYILKVTILLVVYFVMARLGLSLNAVSGFATVVWPPSGIALAVLILYGYRLWPGIALGAFLVNLVVGAPVLTALGISAGNTLEALIGAYLLRQVVGFRPTLERLRDVLSLVVFAALISTAISATIGTLTLLASGIVQVAGFQNTWTSWWVGDMLGDLVVAPLVLVWLSRRYVRPTRRVAIETTLITVLLICAGALIFLGVVPREVGSVAFYYLMFPAFIFIVLRYGQHGSTLAIFALTAVAVWGTIAKYDPSVGYSLDEVLLGLQRFMGLMAVSFMIMAAVVSERKATEQYKRQLLERTIKLMKQRTRLQAINKTKSEFISLASHQLRTPATGVKVYIGMLLDGYVGKLTAKQRDVLESANQFNERQIRIINDLLDVAQIDTGNILLQKQKNDLGAMADEVIDGLQSTIRTSKQKIKLIRQSGSFAVDVDHRRMAMAIENLIVNASKYSHPGKNIEVSLTRKAGFVELSVRDEGVGIARKDLGKLFKKFSRIDNELSVAVGGNGLGLYWTKKIVTLHGGRIRVVSKMGQGSTFTIRLPSYARPRKTT